MDIIPFGKYKGSPVGVMAQDKQYLAWLQGQSWFKDRYPGINTIIINNFGEPAETPDHNQMQAFFTDDVFCLKMIKYMISVFPDRFRVYETVSVPEEDKSAEPRTVAEKTLLSSGSLANIRRQFSSRLQSPSQPKMREMRVKVPSEKLKIHSVKATFEERGIDCILSWYLNDENHFTSFEIKPGLSDDYPAILRQMMANKSEYLFTREYTGKGTSLEQVRKIFASAGKTIVFEKDL